MPPIKIRLKEDFPPMGKDGDELLLDEKSAKAMVAAGDAELVEEATIDKQEITEAEPSEEEVKEKKKRVPIKTFRRDHFWLGLTEDKSVIITSYKQSGIYRVQVIESLEGGHLDIIWQDTQRNPFWASNRKKTETLAEIRKLVPELTPERFDKLAQEFANAEAAGDIVDLTPRRKKETPVKKEGGIEEEIKEADFLTSEEGQALDMLMASPTPLADIKRWLDIPIVREDRKKVLLFVIAASARMKYYQNAAIMGESAGGKNYVAGNVLQFIPLDWILPIARGTATSLDYLEQDYPIIYLQELAGAGAGMIHSMKMSSVSDTGTAPMYIALTVKDPESGEMHTTKIKVKARSFIATTTRTTFDPQLETRTWLIPIDETEEQTKLIIEHTKQVAAGKRSVKGFSSVSRVVREFVRRLKWDWDVVIPYAESINIPPKFTRARRDISKLLGLVATIAVLHQNHRPKIKRDGEEVLVALPYDYYATLCIAGEHFRETLTGLLPALENALQACFQIGGNITSRELARIIKKSQQRTREYLVGLVERGYLVENEELSRANLKIYEVSELGEKVKSGENPASVDIIVGSSLSRLAEETTTYLKSMNASVCKNTAISMHCFHYTDDFYTLCTQAPLEMLLSGEIEAAKAHIVGETATKKEIVDEKSLIHEEVIGENLEKEVETTRTPIIPTIPMTAEILEVIASFTHATVAKVKIAEKAGIPVDRLEEVLKELTLKGKVIDRGAFVEVE